MNEATEDRPRRRGRGMARAGLALAMLAALAFIAVPDRSIPSTIAGGADRALTGRLTASADRVLHGRTVAGFSIAVERNGRTLFAGGFGYADLAAGVPASADTVYRIGSIGKQFTAASLVRLAESGRLSLDDPVSRYLVRTPPSWATITVRQVLSHTSGISDFGMMPVLQRTGGLGMTLEDAMQMCKSTPLAFDPGTNWQYSNCGYLVAGRIVEEVTRGPFVEHLERTILGPLDLRHSRRCPDEPSTPDHARGYDVESGVWTRAMRLGGALSLVPTTPVNLEVVNSAGGICSTVTDLVRWTDALRDPSFLDQASYRAMTSPAVLADGTTVPYGLGMQLRRFGDHRGIAHGGIINGFVGMLVHFPDDGVTVAILANTLLPDPEFLLEPLLAATFDEPNSHWEHPLEQRDRTAKR